MTATTTKRKTRRRTPSAEVPQLPGVPTNGPTQQPAAAEPIESIRLADLCPSPYQPRKTFDQAELANLAASLTTHGLLQPVVVREAGPDAGESFGKFGGRAKFELIAGERRCRAALLAGWSEIPATLRTIGDREARELAVIENLQREDLDPIEEALAYRALLDGDGAPTQQQLAERLGTSQPAIANRLRLLKLPAEWQQRVITREIPPTHARELVPWIEFPQVLESIAKELKEGAPSLGEFREWLRWALHDASEAMQGTRWNVPASRVVATFTPTDEQREALQIRDVPTHDGKTEPRAFNVKLFEKLQDAHEADLMKRKAAKGSKAAKGKAGQTPKAAKEKLTPAEQKAKAKEAAERHQRRLDDFVGDWRRWLIYRTLTSAQSLAGGKSRPKKPAAADPVTPTRILLYLAAGGGSGMVSRYELLDASVFRPRKLARGGEYVRLQQVEDLDAAVLAYLARWFWRDDPKNEGPQKYVFDDTVALIAADLGLDLAAAWQADYCGPLTERYLRLGTKDHLQQLAAELGAHVEPRWTGEQLVVNVQRHLRGVGVKDRQLPKELARYAEKKGGRDENHVAK